MAREFEHHSGLARTLDLVGKRWTLLVAQELLAGPQRYTDLLERLPGLGTNQLASRLRHLERESLVQRRTLPPPAASTVYELTDQGWELEGSVLALTNFGAKRLGEPGPDSPTRAHWAMLALRSRTGSGEVPDREETYEVRVGEGIFHVRVIGGRLRTESGAARDPHLIVEVDTTAAYQLASGTLRAEQAATDGRIKVARGEKDALKRWLELYTSSRPEA